ncbi:MAG: hypothetical protein U1E62_18485 [Alsobacter sp.]
MQVTGIDRRAVLLGVAALAASPALPAAAIEAAPNPLAGVETASLKSALSQILMLRDLGWKTLKHAERTLADASWEDRDEAGKFYSIAYHNHFLPRERRWNEDAPAIIAELRRRGVEVFGTKPHDD